MKYIYNINQFFKNNSTLFFIISIYGLALILFTAFRLFFQFTYNDLTATATFGEILKSYLIGFRFDTLIISYFMLPIVLLLPWFKFSQTGCKIITRSYLFLFFTMVIIALLSDIRFYSYFSMHLNYLAYEYIGEGDFTSNIIASDSKFYTFIPLWIILSILFLFIVNRFYKVALLIENRTNRYNFSKRFITSLLLVILVLIGARGKLGTSPLDWGTAIHSQNHFINQLSLNGLYTFSRSFLEEDHDPRLLYLDETERFPFVSIEDALRTTRNLLESKNETWHDDSTLMRTSVQPENQFGFQPNIILVLMESWSARYTGVLGAKNNLTPYFDSLSQHGILFSKFYSSGTRTNYGMAATICSFPALPGRAILKRYQANHPFVSISEILKKRGYYNSFAYGGDLEFDNMQGFLTSKKYDKFFGKDDFSSDQQYSKWGVPDHILFEKMVTKIDSLPRPFQLTILTLSNHEPYDLPDSSVQKYFDDSDSAKVFNAQLYADHAIGRFMNLIKQQVVADSTLFLFVADHAKFLPRQTYLELDDFHIPLLIYSPLLENNFIDSTIGGQVDILPTIMGLLGGDYTHSSWGRDLLNLDSTDNGFTTVSIGNRIGIVEGNYLYIEQLGQSQYLLSTKDTSNTNGVALTTNINYRNYLNNSFPEIFERLQMHLHRYMQTAELLSTPTVK